MLVVHRSNRLEALAGELARIVREPLGSPLEPETIVVQSKGMERWVSMQLARELGVWANPRFPFPRKLVEETIAAVLGPVPEAGAFEREQLAWTIAALLPGLLDRPELAELSEYLRGDDGDDGDGDGRRRFQLASRIAGVFDQYAVYRPEMVLGWERRHDGTWQSTLWRAIVDRHGGAHVARRAHDFLARLARGETLPDSVPARVSLFGIATLPPLYVDVLSAVGRQREVHLFVLSPSREYWAEIRNRRELARERPRAADGDASLAPSDEALALAEGHPLLASLGRTGRDFHFVLEERADYVEGDRDLYVAPGRGTMLETLQADMLDLVHRGRRRPSRRAGRTADEAPPLPIQEKDESIRLHSCHGPMREVEVLRDRILGLLCDDPTLQPRDVVVMTPDIEAYAPLVEAVFGVDPKREDYLPYRIADRHVRAENEAALALDAILETAPGRLRASEVLDLLAIGAVRERFGIDEAELETVRQWIAAANVRWAVDERHRAEVGQPALRETTWRFGLDRLLLGYAMPGGGRETFGGALPFDDVEGTQADLLGRFAAYCEALFAAREELAGARPVAAWCEVLSGLVDSLVASNGPRAHEARVVREAIAELGRHAKVARFEEAVPLEVVRDRLDHALEPRASSHAFLAGGITFCAMVPMRSIPFRVVCLLGMNDGAFPRLARPPGFDLVARRPRRGDPSRRDEDRYLFLEAVLSARQHLVITYVGQGVRQAETIPPSVVVSELLDVLGESFTVPRARDETEAEAVRKRLVIQHPLQPFSPRYFRLAPEKGLFSFSRSHCDGARALLGTRRTPPPFVESALPLSAGEGRAVSVDALATFFRNPMKAFVQGRLGLSLDDREEGVLDRETMILSPLDDWRIGTRLVEERLRGCPPERAFEIVRASGDLPLGRVGEAAYEDLAGDVARFSDRLRDAMGGDVRLEPLAVDLTIGGTRIVGWLRALWPGGQIAWRFASSSRRKAELEAWIRHLVLLAARRPGDPDRTFVLSRDKDKKERRVSAVRFGPVPNAGEKLADLVALYWKGQEVPLCFFPESSGAYAAAFRETRQDDADVAASARKAARDLFYAERGERANDPYIQKVLGDRDPIDPAFRIVPDAGDELSFAALAERILGPMLDHRVEDP